MIMTLTMTKRIKSLSVFVLTLVLLSSCINLNEEETTKYKYNLVTVSQGGVNPKFLVDDSVYLVPNSAMPADSFQVGERYYIYYLLGDTLNHSINQYPISLHQFGKANVQNFKVYDENNDDIWYNSPISEIGSSWFTSNCWNIIFSSFLGVTTPNTYELVRNKFLESTEPTDTVPVLYFELRHNVSSYTLAATRDQLVCFDLDTLTQEYPQAKRFKMYLRWNLVNNGITYYESTYSPHVSSLDF
jgi:hypothetical protein